MTDGGGVPLAAILTGANQHDVTQLLPLVESIRPLQGWRGRPRKRPAVVLADRGYDSEPHRKALKRLKILSIIARRRAPHSRVLNAWRWVVERTISWLHQFRRLRIRFERRADIHEAFLGLGMAVVCWKILESPLC